MRVELRHDQTRKRMGSAVVIKVVHYSTAADLPKFKQDVKNTIGQRTIRSAVFK